ncbi:MAG: bifunctional nuclease family protein [Acidobacteria bacterium]|nr:bifunctional nuclease family protein [Acidobacteriota bacterium]
MKPTVCLLLTWILAVWVMPLAAQQRDAAVEVTVEDLQPTPYGVSVTLQAIPSDEQLRMFIGITEGEAIARALGRQKPPRPMTHDLIKTILDQTGWHVQRVLIRGISGSTFLADLVLEKDGKIEIVDARPSDAMAIAVRSDAKIFVKPEVFEMERKQRQREPEKETTPSPDGGIHL